MSVYVKNLNPVIHVLLGYIVKEEEMGRECSTHGRDEKFIHYLVGRPEGKRSL
jgi:hypothetical protein